MNLNTLIWSLEELADKEEQLRLWTGDKLGEMGSFEESVSGIFDDSGLARLLDKGVSLDHLSRQAFEQAIVLRVATKKVPRSKSVVELIESLEMDDVRKQAKKLLMLLKD